MIGQEFFEAIAEFIPARDASRDEIIDWLFCIDRLAGESMRDYSERFRYLLAMLEDCCEHATDL